MVYKLYPKTPFARPKLTVAAAITFVSAFFFLLSLVACKQRIVVARDAAL